MWANGGFEMRAEPSPSVARGEDQAPSARILPVAVVIPAYNRATMTRRALESVAAQSPSAPAEVIVVDDGSCDGTPELAHSMGASVVRHKRNLGTSVARNSGIEAATQPWIALLDSDDEWLPHHLDALWRIRGQHVLVGASVLIRAEGSDQERFSGAVSQVPLVLRSPAALVYPQNFVPHSATMIRRQVLLDVGGYTAGLNRAEDLDLLLRVLERGTGIVTPSIGAIYHEHSSARSRQRKEMRIAHREIAASYADRGWMSSSLLERVSGAIRWDDLRATLATGGKAEALHRACGLVSRPQRLLGVAGLLAWRRMGRRQAAVMTRTHDEVELRGATGRSSWTGAISWTLEALLLRALDVAPVEGVRTAQPP